MGRLGASLGEPTISRSIQFHPNYDLLGPSFGRSMVFSDYLSSTQYKGFIIKEGTEVTTVKDFKDSSSYTRQGPFNMRIYSDGEMFKDLYTQLQRVSEELDPLHNRSEDKPSLHFSLQGSDIVIEMGDQNALRRYWTMPHKDRDGQREYQEVTSLALDPEDFLCFQGTRFYRLENPIFKILHPHLKPTKIESPRTLDWHLKGVQEREAIFYSFKPTPESPQPPEGQNSDRIYHLRVEGSPPIIDETTWQVSRGIDLSSEKQVHLVHGIDIIEGSGRPMNVYEDGSDFLHALDDLRDVAPELARLHNPDRNPAHQNPSVQLAFDYDDLRLLLRSRATETNQRLSTITVERSGYTHSDTCMIANGFDDQSLPDWRSLWASFNVILQPDLIRTRPIL
ncbi:MAG: hypothetical protein QF632_06435 [Candidatus Woesearchaeota archaeon]|nr:hypothetical protein [Candidatus Woesearchaeota archaeon]MDP7324372.1 hypothetical protein [Candidatus Woesearchaeota archaeon]